MLKALGYEGPNRRIFHIALSALVLIAATAVAAFWQQNEVTPAVAKSSLPISSGLTDQR